MTNKVLIAKGIIGALQIGLVVLLITSGLHFKDVKQVKVIADYIKEQYGDNPDFMKVVTKI